MKLSISVGSMLALLVLGAGCGTMRTLVQAYCTDRHLQASPIVDVRR